LELSGKRVLIKPNVLRAAAAEEGITTHPAVLRAVVERVEAAGPAAIVVGDNPGALFYGANEASFRKAGLLEAAGAYYQNIGMEAKDVAFNSEFGDRVSLSTAVLEADVIISMPKFKTHGLTTISGALKNCYGFLPGAQKARLHGVAGNPWRFGELIVDVFSLRIPDLFIVDGIVGMEGNGPTSKDLRQIGVIMASNNAVALDATICRMMGAVPEHVPFLQVAKKRGLGEYEADAIHIEGEFHQISNFKLPVLAIKAKGLPAEAMKMLHSRTQLCPAVDEDVCTACETCVEQCPVSALSMEDGFPKVDPDRCITCFCCQEMCSETAIKLA